MDNASLYSSANALQRNDAARVLRQMVPQLPFSNNRRQRVLDIGCGSGDVTADILMPLLPQDVTEIIAVDKSEKMVQHARKVYGSSRMSFLAMDIEDQADNLCKKLCHKIAALSNYRNNRRKSESLDIIINDLEISNDVVQNNKMAGADSVNNNGNSEDTDGKIDKFDFVFSIYCLHWVKNQRQALKNIYHLMNFGGEAVLIILAESEIFTMYQRLAEMEPWSSYMQDLKKFISPYHDAEDPAGMLSEYASSVGFQVVTAVCQQRTFVYRNYQALRDAIKAVNPFYSRMSQQDGEKFLTECINVVKSNNLADTVDGNVIVHYSIVVARLRK